MADTGSLEIILLHNLFPVLKVSRNLNVNKQMRRRPNNVSDGDVRRPKLRTGTETGCDGEGPLPPSISVSVSGRQYDGQGPPHSPSVHSR